MAANGPKARRLGLARSALQVPSSVGRVPSPGATRSNGSRHYSRFALKVTSAWSDGRTVNCSTVLL